MFMVTALFIFTSTTVTPGDTQGQAENIAALFPAIMEHERASMQEPCDDNSQKESYDFIIVGSGTAGCVLANRLSEINKWDILVLEAGGEGVEILNVPYLIGKFQQTDVDWHYTSIPSESQFLGTTGRRLHYARGRGVGGSTLNNYMLYGRGNKRDYDTWEEMGNPGWGFDNVLPYFKKIENMQIGELKGSEFHSTVGNVKVSYPPYKSEMSDILLQAGRESGEQEVDYNGLHQTGFARWQTTTENGSRWTAAKGYLYPIRNRSNLHMGKRALVKKVLINEKTNTAYGVIYTKDGKDYTAKAKKEVILSAGAINTPQLLMVSGVGPKDHLKELGVRVIKDLKVGYNLMDHFSFRSLIFTVNESKALRPFEVVGNPRNLYEYFVNRQGPLTSNMGLEVVSFHELGNNPSENSGWPDVEILYASSSSTNDPGASMFGVNVDLLADYLAPIQNTPAYQAFPFQLRPKSRGRITLKDRDINTPPLIDPNMFSEEEDTEIVIAAIRKAIEINKAPSLQSIGAQLYDKRLPFCEHLEFGSDDYWRCAVLNTTDTYHHPCGTCKMGPATDEGAVVDSRLKVHGIKKLRVVDASIFPQITSGHTQAPTYMVAEKAADLIKEDYLSRKNRRDLY